jgi:AcrR family transcriptional regulator
MKREPRRVYRGESCEQRKLARRERLVEAGIQTFGTTGYSKTLVRDVCRSAQLTERYFYESFADKEALLREAYREVLERISSTYAVAYAAGGWSARTLLTAYFTFIREQPAAARILFFEVVGVSPEVDVMYRETIGGMAADMGRLCGYRADAPMHGLAAAGAMIAIASAWVLFDFRDSVENLVEQTLSFISAPALVGK